MNIENAQKQVDDWIKAHGVRYFNELTNMAQLTEEVGEVARIIARRYGEQSEKESDKNKDLGEELADVTTGSTGALSSGTFTAKKYLWVQAYTPSSSNSSPDGYVEFNADSGTNYAHAFYFGSSTAIRLWHSGQFVSSANDLALNTLGIVSGTYINSSGLGSLYVNGTASGTGTAGNRNIVRDIQIGAIIDSSFFIGEICEVLVFSRVLSATELKQVHTYLGQKWGISNTDRSIVDLSNNNNNGLLGNGTVANMPDYDFYNKGAFKFNGSSDEVNFGDVIKFTSTQDFTLEVWVNYLPNASLHS